MNTPDTPDRMARQQAVYHQQTGAELAALVRRYAIAPDSLHWLARGALLAEVAERLDQADRADQADEPDEPERDCVICVPGQCPGPECPGSLRSQ
jgi:hypothetical protein